MTYKTVEGVLHPDGTVMLPPEELPALPVRVLITVLESVDDTALSGPGEYLDQLTEYEQKLAAGDIEWQ
jgi:hypothetical protein